MSTKVMFLFQTIVLSKCSVFKLITLFLQEPFYRTRGSFFQNLRTIPASAEEERLIFEVNLVYKIPTSAM